MKGVVALVVAATMAASCGGDGTGGTTTTAVRATTPTTTTTTAAPAGSPIVMVAPTQLGATIVDGDGRTLYTFDGDSGGVIGCVDSCAVTWPPLGISATTTPTAPGVTDLGVVTRPDGTRQVTWKEQPLYRYAGDTAPGDVNGEGIGGVWHAALPEAATTAPPSTVAAEDETPTTTVPEEEPAPTTAAPESTEPEPTSPPTTETTAPPSTTATTSPPGPYCPYPPC